jgi:4-diphosphocytidyl-2-C-methyl-D-erythritol kinase
MELKAPAKVNWHLAVGQRRADGYHPIMSVFQTCSLCDTLDVQIADGPFSVDVTGLEELCEKGKSTLDKAALVWHEATGFDKALKIRITKRIPSQAGLGGGSSDAATLLLHLNSMLSSPLTTEELSEIAMKVGCDVPFFIHGCRAAIVSGLGEIVKPIEPRTDLEGFVIVQSGQKTSTKEAYDALDKRAVVQQFESPKELERVYRLPLAQWTFRNDFDIVNKRPNLEVGEGERLLLTGSGSCHILLTKKKKLTLGEGLTSIKVSF